MKKVLLTATVQSHIAQFHKPLINMLKKKGYEVHVAAKNNLKEKNGLSLNEPDRVFDISFNRSPLSIENIAAYRNIKQIINNTTYEVIHCNTPIAGVLTRLAAKKSRKKGTKVFYTVHGFHFYKGSPKRNWLVYYPIEKWFARYTDKLITITEEDFNLANKKFDTEVIRIHGLGANSDRFYPYKEEVNIKLREKSGYSKSQTILLCIGELNKNKNQQAVIRAVKETKEKIPTIKLLLAGNGPREKELKELVKELKLEDNVEFLGYITNLEDYINMSDIVVSASYREGLPLNIMEAMLCSKAVIASKNRGHRELVKDKVTGYLFEPNDIKSISQSIVKLDENLTTKDKLGSNGREYVKPFIKSNVLKELESIYK